MKTIICIDGYTCAPTPDTDELAAKGSRTMLRINRKGGALEIFDAPKGELTAGWVIGLVEG